VLRGVGLVAFTGLDWLDPVIALLVAANIVITGIPIVNASVAGLMDSSVPDEQLAEVESVLAAHTGEGVEFHSLRTRRAPARRFVSFHSHSRA
jgi:divalent metal cation (Fe/Co/Zn/Cd) transporter